MQSLIRMISDRCTHPRASSSPSTEPLSMPVVLADPTDFAGDQHDYQNGRSA
jgi:hypothetical protein